jgi:Clp amino terminal domain, pathogenicity island component
MQAMRRGFQFARELGRRCGPVDFLVGISEGGGPAAAALDPGPGRSLRAVVAADSTLGSGAGYLHMQAQEAARWLAQGRGQPVGPEHLLIALVDQGTPEVLQALSQAGLDPAAVRRAALSAIGAPAGHPPVGMPAPAPAGTMDRPPLPAADLDPRAWAVLRWRQDHLPLHRLRRAGDRAALTRLESAAAWRVAQRLGLGDDQRYSLIHHHRNAVRQAIARAPGAMQPRAPDLAGRSGTHTHIPRIVLLRRRLRRYGLPGMAVLNLMVGWGPWMQNRRNGLRDRWVWLRTLGDYRGCPQP